MGGVGGEEYTAAVEEDHGRSAELSDTVEAEPAMVSVGWSFDVAAIVAVASPPASAEDAGSAVTGLGASTVAGSSSCELAALRSADDDGSLILQIGRGRYRR